MILALLCVAGCGTIHRWEQQSDQADLRREQAAGTNLTDSKAERERKHKQAQREARLRVVQAALATRKDADSLAASALFERVIAGPNSSAPLELAGRAVAAAPERADVAFVQLQLCESQASCDATPLEAHLRQLDPHNGVTWVYALQRADHAEDAPAWVTAFDALAQAQRIDMYWNRIVSRLATATVSQGSFDAGTAVTELIGSESAFSLPLQPVSRVCMVQHFTTAERLEKCRLISAALRHSDTALVEASGTSLGVGLWPAASAERQEIVAERRALRYRVEVMTRNEAKLNSPETSRMLATLIPKYPSEQTTMRALYVQLGLDPDPPVGWKDQVPGG